MSGAVIGIESCDLFIRISDNDVKKGMFFRYDEFVGDECYICYRAWMAYQKGRADGIYKRRWATWRLVSDKRAVCDEHTHNVRQEFLRKNK